MEKILILPLVNNGSNIGQTNNGMNDKDNAELQTALDIIEGNLIPSYKITKS